LSTNLRTFILGLLGGAIICLNETAWAKQLDEFSADNGLFQSGQNEIEVLGGGAFALVWGGIRRNYDYAEGQLRLGWMLNTPSPDPGFFRGNFELLLNTTGADIYHGPGSAFGTVDLLLRYNFVHPNARIVPYYQTGVGVFVSDIADNRTQSEIGNSVEIDVQSALGLRFLLNPQWSLHTEFLYQHVSNAGLAKPNVGINAIGGLIGLSRSF
jgi:lipid A 3-O-deacylase